MAFAPSEDLIAGHLFSQSSWCPVDPAAVTSLAHAQALLTQLQGQQHALRLENRQLHAAQQALAASQARLHAAEAVAGMGSYVLELATGELHFSDGMYRLFGEEPGCFSPSLDWIDARSNPKDARSIRHLLDQAVEAKQPYHYTRRIRRVDGQWRLLESHGRVVCNPAGQPLRLEGVVEDKTAQQHAEQETLRLKDELARYAEDKYRTLFNATDEGFCVAELCYDAQGTAVGYRFLEVNPVFEGQMGLAGVPDSKSSEPAPVPDPTWLDTYAQVVRTGLAVRFDYHQLATRRWYEAYAARVGGEGSRQVCTVFHDVTDRKHAEEYLRQSEERLQQALSIDTVGVLFFNLEGRIHGANEAFARLSGFAQTDLASCRVGLEQVTAPEFLDVTRQSLQELRIQGKSTPYEKQYLRPDGSRWWGLFAGKRLSEDECVKFVLDITDRKQAEEQLHAANKQLIRINADLDNFVYAASHDLKQPVNNLAGLFEEVRRGATFADPAEEQVLLPMVQEALKQLSTTIDELAALGQAQQLSVAPAVEVSLDDLTEEVVNSLEPQVRAAQARITIDFAARPVLSFARANLRTILLNLLGNSLKYADPMRPARIHVSAWVEQGQPVLMVKDNGLGFDASKHGTELFHLFRRLHTHTAGTGVGLYLVNRIVEANGGRIEVESQPGEGATFRIRFGKA